MLKKLTLNKKSIEQALNMTKNLSILTISYSDLYRLSHKCKLV